MRKIRHTATSLTILMATIFSSYAIAVHPNPEPRPGFSTTTLSADGKTTFVVSPESTRPVGDNKIPYLESNIFDGAGVEMVNTLPNTPTVDFNLHDGPVVESDIENTSPSQDLRDVFKDVGEAAAEGTVDQFLIQFGLDILEGNPISRVYSGIPVLHYKGPEKVSVVQPIFDAQGVKIGGNVDVHQVWFNGRIESDTAFIDPTAVQNVPWTITYTVDVLEGGADDFAPWTMYFDKPPTPTSFVDSGAHGPPHVALDASFYAMSQSKRHVIKVKHAPAKYFNLVYTWGWRIHPPRVQVMENALKTAGPMNLRLPQFEQMVFGMAPTSSEAAKLAAIAMIGELSPAKRMWQSLKDAQGATTAEVVALMADAEISLNDWNDRRSLPRGVTAAAGVDITLFYVNNTIYGNARTYDNWNGRGSLFKAKLLNGDHFMHGYVNVDFGGSRGREPQYLFNGGPGNAFTFGRAHWWPTAGGPNGAINVPPVAADGTPGEHNVEITLNFDSPEKITLYQFDPLHHDVAVYSLH